MSPFDGSLPSDLLKSATAMIQDPIEAQALVARLGQGQRDQGVGAPSAPEGPAQLFRILRQTYHSVERSRSRRPARDAGVTALAQASKPDSDSAP